MKNKELQSIIIKTVLFQLVTGLIIFFVVNNYYLDKINTSIVKQNYALVGNLLNNHPDLEEEIIPFITKEIPKNNIKIGEEVLSKYGYTTEMNKSYQPLLKSTLYSFQLLIVAIITFFTIVLVYIIVREYKKIYSKVREVSSAAERVVEGDYNVYLNDEGEGEFNKLNHHFNQMANRLENSINTLRKEKIFLKDTISDISHQLKTPLSSLIMLNELMIEKREMDIKIRDNFLQKTKIQLERMEWLIINLLKVARIEAGAIEFKRDKVYLKDVVSLSLEALRPKFKTENISIKVSKDLNGFFYGDKEWTTEALINIIKNSIEHSGDKGNIEITIEETPLFSSVAIKDYGEGIDKKDLPHIFKKFYRGRIKSKSDSIGIGLNLAKVIIESQYGSISVNSKKGEGTIFTISFLKEYGNLTK